MSETYRIELRESVSCRISAEDRSVLEIELVPILPIEDMLQLLRHALSARGYEAQGDHQLRRTGDHGEEIVVDLETMEVTTCLAREEVVERTAEVEGGGMSQSEAEAAARHNLEEEKRRVLQGIEAREQPLQRLLTKQLEAGEEARRLELNEALQQVYADSLKQKAEQLGEVLEVHESTVDGQYELVIKIAQ